MILLVILGYFLIGFITGIVICKFKGKEWCRANTVAAEDDVFSWKNNAECVLFFSTFAWVLLIVVGPFFIFCHIVDYTAKKLQK